MLATSPLPVCLSACLPATPFCLSRRVPPLFWQRERPARPGQARQPTQSIILTILLAIRSALPFLSLHPLPLPTFSSSLFLPTPYRAALLSRKLSISAASFSLCSQPRRNLPLALAIRHISLLLNLISAPSVDPFASIVAGQSLKPSGGILHPFFITSS